MVVGLLGFDVACLLFGFALIAYGNLWFSFRLVVVVLLFVVHWCFVCCFAAIGWGCCFVAVFLCVDCGCNVFLVVLVICVRWVDLLIVC